jgi:hypothetical protein
MEYTFRGSFGGAVLARAIMVRYYLTGKDGSRTFVEIHRGIFKSKGAEIFSISPL